MQSLNRANFPQNLYFDYIKYILLTIIVYFYLSGILQLECFYL